MSNPTNTLQVTVDALEGLLENYLTLKRISLIVARSDGPWAGSHLTEDDDVHVIAARAALALAKGSQ